MVRWQVSAILGAVATAALTAAALIGSGGAIHRDLVDRTGRVLAGEATSWASVEIRGRDVMLLGTAPTEDLRTLAVSRLERAFGVRGVDASAVGLLPFVEPYFIRLARDGDTLALEGYAPSLPERARISAGLRQAAPGLVYADRLDLARGMPEDGFLEALRQVQRVASVLRRGTILVRDHGVTIAGEAASNADFDRLASLVGRLPDGYRLVEMNVTRPVASPFVWSVTRSDDGALAVAGYVPDPQTRDRLRAVLDRVAGDWPVGDDSDLASGAPDGFADTAADAADYIDLLAAGRIELSDDSVTVSGRAATPEAYRTLVAFLETWAPSGFVVHSAIDLPRVTPYTLTASRSAGRMTISGFVPDDDARRALKEAAEAYGKSPVVETTLAAGAPDGFLGAATFAVDLLGRLSSGTVVLSDGHIRLDGEAGSSSDFIELQAAAANPPPGFRVDLMTAPPTISPYVWRLEKSADQLVVTGAAPSEAERNAVRDRLEDVAGDSAVLDRTTVAAGLPAGVDFGRMAAFAADLVAHLDEGTVTFSDGTVSVSGKPSSADDAAAIDAALKAPPAGIVLGETAVDRGPPFSFIVERGLDAVVIDGVYGDEAMKDAVLSAARRAFGGGADIEATLTAGASLPDMAEAAALAAIDAASRLAKGKVSVADGRFEVEGVAFTGAAATRFAAEIAKAVPEGFRVEASVAAQTQESIVDGPACERAFGSILAGNAVAFDGATATIADTSRGLVDRLAAAALRCPAARLSVSGYADDKADRADNVALAEARARAVAGVLADAGVDPARLAVGGRGDGHPPSGDDAGGLVAGHPLVEIHVVPAP